MKLQKICAASGDISRLLVAATAAIATTAAFAKSFVPFYLIGSTPIFAATCVFGMALVAVAWRDIRDNAVYAADALLVLGLLYGAVVTNYFIYSAGQVPMTHLLGILIFHSLFLVFGFAAARALKTVYMVLLAQAAIYLIIIGQYAVRFGDLMRDGYLHDIFGVGGIDSKLVTTFHQPIGTSLGLAVLAMLGLAANRRKFLAVVVLPFVFWFMFHIAARAAMVALVCSLIFLVWADAWVRSKKLASMSLAVVTISAALASGLFYEYAVKDRDVDLVAPDAISRTIREIQSQDPGFRLPIWERTWHRITSEPDRLLFGRGIGMFPIDEGVGAPDWLLRKTEAASYSPHNVHLELLYETGMAGMLIFSILTLFPLAAALKHWKQFWMPEKAAISLYVFYLVSVEISGSFAFSYDFQFFLALAIGVVSLKRKELAGARTPSFEYLDHQVSA